jgi:three-Cys-motif partner protein
MTQHKFGGDWTEEKLSRLRKYLPAYRKIFAPRRYFTTWYVDAFAGTGSRVARGPETDLFGDVYDDEDTRNYREGSARIALSLQSPFDRYLSVEKSKAKANELEQSIKTDFAEFSSRCHFEIEDANDTLKHWCDNRNWKNERAVVFLDPYGMQVAWRTVEILGATNGIDLWYLFPLGAGRDADVATSW